MGVILLRLLGLTLAAIGGAFILWGSLTVPIHYKDFRLDVPLHVLMLLFGLVLLFAPVLAIQSLIVILPSRMQKPLQRYLDAELAPVATPTPNTPEGVAAMLRDYIHSSLRRWLLTVFVFVVFIVLILPFLVQEMIARSATTRDLDALVRQVNELRLDLTSADDVRHVLRSTAGSFGTKPEAHGAAGFIYMVLKELYDDSIDEAPEFESAMHRVYEKRVTASLRHETDELAPATLRLGTDDDPPIARAAALTLLGLICNEEAGQGEHVAPTLHARQLLRAADDLHLEPGHLPALHFALGWNYSDTLRGYKAYVDRAGRVAKHAYEARPIARLHLARTAADEYRMAESEGTTAFSKARYFNNRADLIMSLIEEAHLQSSPSIQEATNDGERSFLVQNVDPPQADPWKPVKLWGVLDELKRMLDSATTLVREPRVYYTRAQLLSLGGALSAKYKNAQGIWANLTDIADAGVRDLRTARELGMPPRFFERAMCEKMLLGWLVEQQPAALQRLAE